AVPRPSSCRPRHPRDSLRAPPEPSTQADCAVVSPSGPPLGNQRVASARWGRIFFRTDLIEGAARPALTYAHLAEDRRVGEADRRLALGLASAAEPPANQPMNTGTKLGWAQQGSNLRPTD